MRIRRAHQESTRDIRGFIRSAARDRRGCTALPPGTYTVAFTQAAQDNPVQADPAVTFSPVITGIVVTADNTTTVNIS